MPLLKRFEVVDLRADLLTPETLSFALGERADQSEIRKHARQLIDGVGAELLMLITWVDAVDVRNHKIRARAMMQKMTPHPV